MNSVGVVFSLCTSCTGLKDAQTSPTPDRSQPHAPKIFVPKLLSIGLSGFVVHVAGHCLQPPGVRLSRLGGLPGTVGSFVIKRNWG